MASVGQFDLILGMTTFLSFFCSSSVLHPLRYQLSAMLPLMRVHSRVQNPPHWPWLYGPAAEEAMRTALQLRYRLLPFVYSLAHHAHTHGVPVVRPLVYDFPGDARVSTLADEFTLGGSLLAAPVLVQGAISESRTYDGIAQFRG